MIFYYGAQPQATNLNQKIRYRWSYVYMIHIQLRKTFHKRLQRTPDFKVKRDKYITLGLASSIGLDELYEVNRG